MSESFPVTDISDDKLLELWRDPIFSGSYIDHRRPSSVPRQPNETFKRRKK